MSYAGSWKPEFIAKLKQTGSPKRAARLMGLPWSTVTSARKRDKTFRQAWDAAIAAPAKPDATVTLQLPARAARILLRQLNSQIDQD